MSAGDEGLGIEWPDVPGLPPGYVEDLEPGPDDDETLDRQELEHEAAAVEELDEGRWEVLEAGLVSLLDALGDVVARLDKLDARLDVIAERLSDLEAAVEAEDGQPQVTVSVPTITREQAEEVAAVLARIHRAQGEAG